MKLLAGSLVAVVVSLICCALSCQAAIEEELLQLEEHEETAFEGEEVQEGSSHLAPLVVRCGDETGEVCYRQEERDSSDQHDDDAAFAWTAADPDWINNVLPEQQEEDLCGCGGKAAVAKNPACASSAPSPTPSSIISMMRGRIMPNIAAAGAGSSSDAKKEELQEEPQQALGTDMKQEQQEEQETTTDDRRRHDLLRHLKGKKNKSPNVFSASGGNKGKKSILTTTAAAATTTTRTTTEEAKTTTTQASTTQATTTGEAATTTEATTTEATTRTATQATTTQATTTEATTTEATTEATTTTTTTQQITCIESCCQVTSTKPNGSCTATRTLPTLGYSGKIGCYVEDIQQCLSSRSSQPWLNCIRQTSFPGYLRRPAGCAPFTFGSSFSCNTCCGGTTQNTNPTTQCRDLFLDSSNPVPGLLNCAFKYWCLYVYSNSR